MERPTTLTAASYSRQSRASRKSIDDQACENREAGAENGWELVVEYSDGSSASRFARKTRTDWEKVVNDIRDHRFDILILWESSRGDRDAASWLGLLATCRDRNVRVHVVTHHRTYDLANARDWRTLAEDGIDNQYESEKISERTIRGQRHAAKAGRPSQGRTPFGYERVYHPRNGQLHAQQIDETTAAIVREVFERVARGEPISTIADDLDARGAPAPGRRWYRQRVLDVCHNVAYIGKRQYNGQVTDGQWEPIVDEAMFWAADRVLADPSRRTSKPGRWKHLLSYLATCGACDSPMTAVRGRYRCSGNGCVTIVETDTDKLVTDAVLRRVARPDIYQRLRSADEQADRQAAQARGVVEALRAKLREARESFAKPAGGISAESLAHTEAALLPQIAQAERVATTAGTPMALRQLVEPGADVRARWRAMPLPVRRDAIKTLMSVSIAPATITGRRAFEPRRVQVRWHRR